VDLPAGGNLRARLREHGGGHRERLPALLRLRHAYKESDANQLSNIRTDLDKFAIHEAADLEAFAKEWFSAKRRVEKLQGVVNPVAKKWLAEAEDDQASRKTVHARQSWRRV